MSYILEALKKSEAERRLGEVPGLDASAASPGRSEGEAGPAPRPGWLLPLALLVLVNLGLTAWLLLDRGSPDGEAAGPREAGVGVTPPTVRSGPVREAPAAMETPAATAPSVGRDDSAPAPSPPPQAQVPPRPAQAPSPPPAASSSGETGPPAASAGRRAGGAEAAFVEDERRPSAAPPDRLPVWDELPAELRAVVPRPRLDVHVYDSDPGRRFVRLDLRKYREGDRTAEGLLVARILREGAVLCWHDSCFLLPRP